MARPAGTNHHQAPCARACWPCAQNRIVPQFQSEIDETPMKARVISDMTAKMTVPTKLDAMIAVRFGRISKSDDAPGPFAVGPGGLDVVAAAQRQRLRAQHPGAPRPRREADDERRPAGRRRSGNAR